MSISGVIPQLLLANGATIAADVHDTPWQTRECIIRDDQGDTLSFGEDRSPPHSPRPAAE